MGNRTYGVRLVGLVLLLFGVCSAASSAVAARTTDVTLRGGTSASIDAKCAGDTIFGELRSDAPAGTSYVLTLLQQRVKRGTWLPTNKSVAIVTRPRQHSYPFSFDVAAFGADAYAITGAGKDEIVRAASCAPGHQVPEAPNALLLAAVVAGVFGVSLTRRRRRPCIR
jgi:hypothetical protein